LRSGAFAVATNVIVFALWYVRLDGGGPTLRHERNKFGSTSFLFPQIRSRMMSAPNSNARVGAALY